MATFYYTPSWSPDSKKLLYTDTNLNVWVMDIATGQAKIVGNDVPLELQDARIEEDGTLVVDCRLEGEWDGWKAGVAAFALLGSVAEPGTFVEMRQLDDRLELDIATGVVSDEGSFATHGHTLRLHVTA
jgi:hypothetical protein